MTARVGDWYALAEGAHAVVLGVDGDRALCVDPYTDISGWIELPAGLEPLSGEDVARRIERLLEASAQFDAEGASHEKIGRLARCRAEHLRGVVDMLRLLTANREHGS